MSKAKFNEITEKIRPIMKRYGVKKSGFIWLVGKRRNEEG